MKKELRAQLNQQLRGTVYHQNTDQSNLDFYVHSSFLNNKDMLDEELSEAEVRKLPVMVEAYRAVDDLIKMIVKSFASQKKVAIKTSDDALKKQMFFDEIMLDLPSELKIIFTHLYGSQISPDTWVSNYQQAQAKIVEDVRSKLSKKQLAKLRKLLPNQGF